MEKMTVDRYRAMYQGLEEIVEKARLNDMERALLQDAMTLVFQVKAYSLTYGIEIV